MNLVKKMVLLALSAMAHWGYAAGLVSNGGFEAPGTVTTYQYLSNGDSTSIPGWSVSDDGAGEKPYLMNKNRPGGSYTNRVFEGSFAIALNQGSGITTTFPVTAGTTYTLTFYARKNNTTGYAPLEVTVAGTTTGFADITTSFQGYAYTFTATTTDPAAVLRFTNPSPTPDYKTYDLDAVSVVEGIVTAPPPPQSAGDPLFASTHFLGSGNCSLCHDNLTSTGGLDVSIVRDWSSTMMANSARDPFWRAKVRTELDRNPNLASTINDKCSRCHAPMANFEAKQSGDLLQILDGGFLSPTNRHHDEAMDGVSCTLCHQIKPSSDLGTPNRFSGNFEIDASKIIYGPFGGPGETAIFTMPMMMHTGYTPTYSPHVKESKLCATCHNLKTPYVDKNGNLSSDEFPEQMPYTEWEYSSYANAEPKTCQQCHLTRVDGAPISNRPPWLERRNGFALHEFVGGNKMMLNIFKNNRMQLGVLSNNFDETLAKTDAMLKKAATISVVNQGPLSDSLAFTLRLTSNTGHKLPTSYPSRRAILHVVVKNAQNQIVWESGQIKPDGRVVGVDADEQPGQFEPHHDLITSPDQVQVYESIMGNDENQVTYTLLRGKSYLKDNRLLPKGFDKLTAPSDVGVVGSALTDGNFVGGSDEVSYRIGGLGPGTYSVTAELVYQTLAFGFAQDLFSDTNPPEVASFKNLYDAAGDKTTIIAAVQFSGEVAATDTDGDGIPDASDNCTQVANANQRDTDNDGFGNLCDPDFNQNRVVDPTDLSRLKSWLGKASPNGHEDLNGNGIVDPADFSIAKNYLGKPPGPSGMVP